MECTLGFIGGGRITAILLEAWHAAGILPGSILVSDSNPAALAKLRARHPGIETATDNALPLERDLVFLALHPPALRAALGVLGAGPKGETTVVSLAPVLNFQTLSEVLHGHARLVRMIPNAPSRMGHGFNPVAFAPGSTIQDRARLAPLLSALGQAPEIPEVQIEAYAVLCAMGPTYFWPQWQLLRELGQQFGLAATDTDTALTAMLHGAVDLLFQGGLGFEETMDTIPAKPLAEAQEGILAPFRDTLPALHARLTQGAIQR